MAESQLRHRQGLEGTVVNANISSQKRGQVFAFILGFIAIAGGIVLIALDKSTQGLVAIITAFVALAGVFVYGRLEQERERERKRRELREIAENPRLPLIARAESRARDRPRGRSQCLNVSMGSVPDLFTMTCRRPCA
jgi:hypothetical protein